MSWRHLSCASCRIRVRADAREIDLLDGRCPICGEMLGAVSPASSVLGFRSFDLDTLSDHPSNELSRATGEAVDLVASHGTTPALDDFGADRWSDDGGAVNGETVTSVAGGGVIGARTLA
jgi:hypothetical protein